MTKSRRVMAVIVAALLIVAMILPGLVVKAEAAGGEKTGETDRVTTKATIESKDNKTLQYKPGESQKWTLVITNKTGQKLSNLSVSPDMGGENADAWPFKTDYQKYEQKMTKTLDGFEAELTTIRAGRANPHVLDKVKVDYYGVATPVAQVGNVSVPEARTIMIQPWEPNLLKEIEKAIMMSDLGINPSDDGRVIRLVFPELTEDRRKELVKEVKKKAEGAKVAIRNIRRDANDAFKKLAKEDVSEDEIKELEEQTQKLTDKYIKEVDQMVDVKSKEIMTV
mgnify:CR=1 FL=1